MNKNRQKKACLLSAFMVFGAMAAYAQSPGGISTAPAVWYKPDSVSASKWKDASINGLDLTTQDTTATYRVSVNNGNQVHNFHKWTNGYTNTKYYSYRATTNPAFGAWGDGGVTTTASTDYSGNYYYMPLTVFGVARGTAANATGAITGIDNDQGYGAEPGFGIYGGKQSFYRWGNGADIRNNAAAIAAPVNASAVYLWRPPAGGSTASGNDTLLMGTNGAYSKISIIRKSSVAGPHINIGTDNFAHPSGFDGSIQEVIWYKDSLSNADIQKVETYLSLKYGTTLAHNYVSAAGGILYNIVADSNYRYNIAGIGHESANGGLNQKQSNSVNTGSQVLVSTTGLANTNSSNTTALTDGQYLVWGDNGLAKSPAVPVSNIVGTNYRFASVWNVQNTGSVGTVRVAWPQNIGFGAIKLVQSSDSTFATGNTTTDMTANTQVVNGITYNYADVTLADGQYFTFAVQVLSPGGIATLPAVWYRSQNVTNGFWKDASVNGLNLTNQSTTGDTMVMAGNQAHNFNTWTTNYSSSNYYNYIDSTAATTNSEVNPVFGNFNVNSYSYMPISIFGVARPTSSAVGSITGIDNESANAAEPGLTVYPEAGGVSPRFYRFGNGVDNIATSKVNGLNETGVYFAHPYPGDGTATGTEDLIVGLNGSDTTIAGTNPRSSVAGPYLKIGYSAFGFNQFQGDIQEVIWYKNTLTAVQKGKVETYLALNYGTTLAHSYVNAAGDTVYDLTSNAGYGQNIAGIGREKANADLNQKQSNSVNVGNQVIISTTGLANTNDSNTTSLTEGQFLVWGDNGKAKSPSESVSGIAGVNARFASVWKVENTGAVGTVRVAWIKGLSNLTLIQSSDTIFDGTDASTLMTGNEITVNNVVYNYADVTLSNGSYFTFGALMPTPGGVVAAAWYRADAMTTVFSDTGSTVATDGASLAQWNEFGGRNSFNLRQTTASQQPVYSDSAVLDNFNPTVTFPGGGSNNAFLQQYSDDTVIDRANGTLFASGYFNTVHGQFIFGFDETGDYPGLHTGTGSGTDNILMFSAGSSYNSLSGNAYVAGDYVIAGANWENGAGLTASYASTLITLNGVDTFMNGNTLLNVNLTTANTQQIRLGGDNNWGTVDGQVNEAIVFENALDSTEMLQVSSYLAIKYGKTLANGTVNYLNSHGNVVWDPTVNTGYQNNIAGIALDNNGGLDQRQSWSMNAGRQVLISTTGLANTNNANAVNLSDGQFLIWGDNGLAKSPTVYTANTFSNVNVRFAAIWKVQNTGSVDTVRVAWPAGLSNLSLIQSADTTFNASDVLTDMSANTQVVNGITYNYADVTLANGQYFTLASKIEHAPGGVFEGLAQWFRADKQTTIGTNDTLTSWTDYAMNIEASRISTAALPLLHSGDATYLNFNPGVNFTAINQKIGNLSIQTIASRNYDIFSLTKEGIAGGRFYNVGRNNTTMDGSNWDSPGLYANSGVARRDSVGNLKINGGVGTGSFLSNTPSATYYSFTNTTALDAINGSPLPTAVTTAALGLPKGGFIFGDNTGVGTSGDDGGIVGNIGDLIVYNTNLTTNERNRVDAYLAIKYGITLDTASSYLTSASTVVWDKTADKDFYHNVAGIGRDDVSDLYQKQSRSQITNNVDSQITIALDSIYATNLANPSSIGDQQFLVWGDNGNTQAMTNVASTYTTFSFNGSSDNRRMNRIWKVRNSGVTHNMALSFPVASVGATTLANEGANTAYVIIYAADTGFTNITAISYLSDKNGQYAASHKFPDSVSYFTFAKVTDSVSPLPVTLFDFTANKENSDVLLHWMTTSEQDNKGFDVERSLDGKQWESLGFVVSQAQEGNSHLKLSYAYTDHSPVIGRNFYRLKQMDINGRYVFSPVRSVVFEKANVINVYPNPVKNKVVISGLQGVNAVTISNALGQVVLKQSGITAHTATLSTDQLVPGTYILTVLDEKGNSHNFKMVKR